MSAKHEKYERLIDARKSIAPTPTAVAHPCDASSLPIILTSRADSVIARLASRAVAVLVAKARREAANAVE